MRKYGTADEGRILPPEDEDQQGLSKTSSVEWTEQDADELAAENAATDKD